MKDWAHQRMRKKAAIVISLRKRVKSLHGLDHGEAISEDGSRRLTQDDEA